MNDQGSPIPPGGPPLAPTLLTDGNPAIRDGILVVISNALAHLILSFPVLLPAITLALLFGPSTFHLQLVHVLGVPLQCDVVLPSPLYPSPQSVLPGA